MAFLTVPIVVTTVLAVRYIGKRRRERARLAGRSPREELDTSVVGATIVLTSLPQTLMERILDQLPPEMAKAIILVIPELPPIAQSTVEQEKKRWLSHFTPPRQSLHEIELEEPGRLAAATVRLVLEDATL